MPSVGEHMHCNACLQTERASGERVTGEPVRCTCKCTLCSLALEVEGAHKRADDAVRLWTKAVRAGAR